MPLMDGRELCAALDKAFPGRKFPIFVMTSMTARAEREWSSAMKNVTFLEKPVSPRELVARVKSVLRRAAPERRRTESAELRHGDLVINSGKREVYVGDEEIRLAPKEFDLLWELLDHRGLVLTRDQLLERVWGYDFEPDTNLVDVYIRRLRQKLTAHGGDEIEGQAVALRALHVAKPVPADHLLGYIEKMLEKKNSA